jgi:hypothetical protein
MRIVYTHHAQQRMVQRKISVDQVEKTIDAPDEILPGDNGEEIAVRRYGNYEIRVVYEETETDTAIIYTVIKTRAQVER